MSITQGYGTHAVICTAGSKQAYNQSLRILRNLGTLVCIGLTDESIDITPFQMVVRGKHSPYSGVREDFRNRLTR